MPDLHSMMKSHPKILSGSVLAITLLFASFCHFTSLDWGLPSRDRTFHVVGEQESVKKWIPKMIEQRKKYYAMVDNLMDRSQSFDQSYQRLSQRWVLPLFEVLSGEIVLDRMRNYLIGVNISDEQVTMTALSGINPKKLDFVPGTLAHYGGWYYYTAGGFLVLGKILGQISLNPGVEYYFYHPEEIRGMYQFVRAVGGASIVAVIILLFFMIRRFYDDNTALLTILFFAVIPLMVPISHLTKAHLYGMFWITAGLYFCGRVLKDPEETWRASVCAGVALGLCAGTIITNLLSGAILFFTFWIRQGWNLKRLFTNKNFWISVSIFFAVYVITNFYVFLYFSEFVRKVQATVAYFPAFTSIQWHQWIPYLVSVCTEQVHWTVFPLLLIGAGLSIRRRDPFMLLCTLSFAVLFLQNLLTTRHPPVNARALPFIAILSGWAAGNILTQSTGWPRIFFSIYIFLSLTVSGIQCLFYNRLHRDPANIDIAGRWINENVPKGSSVGVWGGGFAPFDFPAIRFLDYQMVHIPHIHVLDESASGRLDQMPRYIVLAGDHTQRKPVYPGSRILEKDYKVTKEWKGMDRFMGFRFKQGLIKTGNWGIRILEKSAVD